MILQARLHLPRHLLPNPTQNHPLNQRRRSLGQEPAVKLVGIAKSSAGRNDLNVTIV